MPKYHTVIQGESISSIAKAHGFFDWNPLYNRPENAKLKELRPNPDIVYPGDKVYIPDKENQGIVVQVNQLHTFKIRKSRDTLKLKIAPTGDQVWSDRKVELELEDQTLESNIDTEGFVSFTLPHKTSDKALLLVYSAKDTEQPSYRVSLKLGQLDPIETPSGQQARLTSLGHESTGEDFEPEIKDFQQNNNLISDGICGPITQQKLEETYGC